MARPARPLPTPATRSLSAPNGIQGPTAPNRGKPELIVITRPEAQMKVLEGAPASVGGGMAIGPLAAFLETAGAVLRPLFGPNDDHVRFMSALLPKVLNRPVPDLTG